MTDLLLKDQGGVRGQYVRINKDNLINTIHERFNGELPKQTVDDAILIIADLFSDVLVNEESITIQNFGTIHTFMTPKLKYINFFTKEPGIIPPQKKIKFLPHIIFKSLIQEKKIFLERRDVDRGPI